MGVDVLVGVRVIEGENEIETVEVVDRVVELLGVDEAEIEAVREGVAEHEAPNTNREQVEHGARSLPLMHR